MENLFWAVVVGFSVVAFLLYGVLDEIGHLRNDVQEMKDEPIQQLKGIEGKLGDVEDGLGWHGTLRKQLTDIETAIRHSR
jgi:hypothetical protein